MPLRRLAATLALLLLVGTTDAAPAWSAPAPGSGATVAADVTAEALMERLDSGQSAVVTLLGDSTGDATTEWFYLLAEWLAERYPAHHTTYWAWDRAAEAYNTKIELGGSVRDPATLTIYNGSAATTRARYVYENDTRFADLTRAASDLYLISYSHNEGAATTFPDYTTLTDRLRAKHPAAGIVPVLQNPEGEGSQGKTPAQIAAHAQRLQIIRTLAGENRWPVVDAYNAFRADPRKPGDLVPDGVHPLTAGQALWAGVAQRMLEDQSARGEWTDCPTGSPATGGYLCLWDNTNYDNGRLQRTYETLRNTTTAGIDGCWNLNGSSFSSGFWAYDSASSWALRKNPDSATRYRVQIFDWINCNTDGNHRTYVVDQDYAAADLRTIGWNNTAASIRVTIAP